MEKQGLSCNMLSSTVFEASWSNGYNSDIIILKFSDIKVRADHWQGNILVFVIENEKNLIL